MDTSNNTFESALEFHKKNDHKNAEKKYREYLKTDPKNSQCLFMLGTLLIQEKRFKDAIIELNKAIIKDSKNYHYFHNLGIAYFENNQFDASINAYKQSIFLNNKNADSYNNLGNSFYKLKKHAEAIINFNLAIKLSPNKKFLINRAECCIATHEFNKAFEDLLKIEESSIFFREAEDLMVDTYDKVGKHKESVPIYEARLKNYADKESTHKNKMSKEYYFERLIYGLKSIGDNDKMGKYISDFENEFPKAISLHRIKAILAFGDRRYEVAIKLYEQVLKMDPRSSNSYHDIAVCYNSIGDRSASKIYHQKCLDIDKHHTMSNVCMGIHHLIDKKFTRGWPHYEYRLLAGAFLTHKLKYIFRNEKLRKWDGKNDGYSVLIFSEQGIGDQIILSKLLSKIRGFQNQFTIVIDERLIPILKRAFPDNNFNFVSDKINIEGFFDYQAAMFRLGYLFVNNEEDVIFPDKYLLANKLNLKKSTKLRCGISWHSRNWEIAANKNLKLCDLIKVTSNYDFDYINLQYGDHEAEIASAEESNNVEINRYNELDKFNDLDGLFSLVDSCDIIITISNITAHIAGSLGKKVYLIVPRSRGLLWYWHTYKETTTSLWYPSIEILKSTSPSSLNSSLEILKAKLKDIYP